MGRILAKMTRFILITGASTTAAAGLIATLPPASQAATGHLAARHHTPGWHAPTGPSRLALAGLMAAQERRPGTRFPVAPVGAARAAQVSARARTGIITGLVKSAAGQSVGDACVSAVGSAGNADARTKANGRYLLSGLRPGRYRVRVGSCPAGRAVTGSPMISLWPGLAGTVAVRAGQLVTLRPATLEQASPLPRGPLAVGATTKTGSISGRVTGKGKPVGALCVEAFPVRNGLIAMATTSKTGKYRLTGLRPGLYVVQFASFGCGSNRATGCRSGTAASTRCSLPIRPPTCGCGQGRTWPASTPSSKRAASWREPCGPSPGRS